MAQGNYKRAGAKQQIPNRQTIETKIVRQAGKIRQQALRQEAKQLGKIEDKMRKKAKK